MFVAAEGWFQVFALARLIRVCCQASDVEFDRLRPIRTPLLGGISRLHSVVARCFFVASALFVLAFGLASAFILTDSSRSSWLFAAIWIVILALAVSFPFLTALPRLWLRARVEALNGLAIAEIQERQRKTQSESKRRGTWLMLADQAAESLARGIEGDPGGRVSLAGALLATLSEVAQIAALLISLPDAFRPR
jgi:hypothetical protein